MFPYFFILNDRNNHLLLFVPWTGRGSNSSQLSAGTALSKSTQHFPALDVQRRCAHGVCVLRVPVPDEMGKYSCFSLRKCLFLFAQQGFILFMSFIMQLSVCARGNLTIAFRVWTETLEGDTEGAHRAPPFFRHGTSQAVGVLPCCFSRKALTGELLLGAVI